MIDFALTPEARELVGSVAFFLAMCIALSLFAYRVRP